MFVGFVTNMRYGWFHFLQTLHRLVSLCRPLAAWKNSSGRYEISRETVSVDEEAVELKLVHNNNIKLDKVLKP